MIALQPLLHALAKLAGESLHLGCFWSRGCPSHFVVGDIALPSKGVELPYGGALEANCECKGLDRSVVLGFSD